MFQYWITLYCPPTFLFFFYDILRYFDQGYERVYYCNPRTAHSVVQLGFM